MLSDNSGKRLVTQNLVAAAALYEKNEQIDWDAIYELSVFIDIVCLYDQITFLGRQAYSLFNKESDFLGAIKNIVQVRDFVEDSKVIETACTHLGAFLGDTRGSKRYRQLIDFITRPDSIERAFSPHPDEPEDFQMGEEWLRRISPESDVVAELERQEEMHRSVTFRVRTFLYLAFADVYELPFTPDAARAQALPPIISAEQNLRARLIGKLKSSVQQNRMSDDFGLTRKITPLAAIVFERAWPNKENIARVLVDLRAELAPLRARLCEAEDALLWGSREDEIAASRKWNGVFEEIERQFGSGEGIMSMHRILRFAVSAAKAGDEPHKVAGWANLLALPVAVVERVLARRPVIEIHRLGRELPSSANLRRTAHKLFGDSIR